MSTFSWKENCFLCSKDAIEDKRHPNRNPRSHVTTIDFRKNIIEQCKKRKDDWGNEVETRLSCSHDLVADEGVYHTVCLSRFMLNWPSHNAEPKRQGRPAHDDMIKSFNELCIWLDTEADGELYTVSELHLKMVELANGNRIYGIKWLKQKLKDRYKDSIHFAEISGRSDVVCFRNMAHFILNEAWYSSRKKDKNKDAERIIVTAAKLIMADIREKEYDTSYYPTHTDIVCPEEKEWLPNHLKMFLEVLIKSQIKQNSIGQSIIYATRPRTVIPPIPFGLGVEMDHVFGSKWLINELYRLGFSISYDEVTRFKQSVIEDTDATELAGSFAKGTFTQFVADNVDHNVCSLDGKGTFHGMGVISTSVNSTDPLIDQNKQIRRQNTNKALEVVKNRGIDLVQYIAPHKSGLSDVIFKPICQLQSPQCVLPSASTDLLWHTARLFDAGNRPSWSGFMQTTISGEYPGKARVCLLPIINLNPSDESCVYSTLLFVKDQCKLYDGLTPCITFDQPLWLKATEIIKAKSLQIVCRLGGFHTMMSFLGSIGTMMKGSGLSECLETIYGANAVKHMMSGKALSRALRGHFLIESVLVSKLINELIQPITEADRESEEEIQSVENTSSSSISNEEVTEIEKVYRDFVNGTATEDDVLKTTALENLNMKLQLHKDNLAAKSRTAKLWMQYIYYINVIKVFIRAERTGNWNVHLTAVGCMLNLFSATGHINYAKSGRLYLQMMLELPSTYPDLYVKFADEGYHTVRRSDRFWGGLWTDLVIEQVMMRSLKSRGGLTRGRGVTESVLLSWIHSMHGCASVHNSMTELTNLQHKTSEQHVELGRSRIKRDNSDLEKLDQWFNTYNPFLENESSLKSIFSGLTSCDEDNINCDQTEAVGNRINVKLDNVVVTDATIKKKDQIRTLECLKVGVKIDKENIYVDPMLLFSRLLVIVERDDNMLKYFKYELTPEPTSLFDNGVMRKATKSNLAKMITQNSVPVSPSGSQIFVLDGGALLHKVKWLPGRDIKSILNQYSKYILERFGICCVVFDGYDNGPYIKDHEHKRRSSKKSADVTLDSNTTIIVKQEMFLKNEKNKSQLISLLSSHLTREGHDIRNSDGDADTLIVSTALEYASKGKEVVVVASDTDILVLLMFHWEVGMDIFMYAETGKRNTGQKEWNIEDLVLSAGEKVTRNILFIHAWTGCDTTSAIYRQGILYLIYIHCNLKKNYIWIHKNTSIIHVMYYFHLHTVGIRSYPLFFRENEHHTEVSTVRKLPTNC